MRPYGDYSAGFELSNFKEYAFGLDPKDGASIQAITSLSSPSISRFTYIRRKASLSGLNYAVWWSDSLTADSWAKDSGAVETVISTADDVETLQVTLSPSLLSLPKLFLRVSAITP